MRPQATRPDRGHLLAATAPQTFEFLFSAPRPGTSAFAVSRGGHWQFRMGLLTKTKNRSVLVAGLDNAGKSTLLCALPQVRNRIVKAAKHNGLSTAFTLPTPGMQLVEMSMFKRQGDDQTCWRRWCCLNRKTKVSWQIWDLSGQGRHRPLWLHYCTQVHAIIFVVDLTDPARVAIARDELAALTENPAVLERRTPFLFFAHKQDLAQEMDTALSLDVSFECFACFGCYELSPIPPFGRLAKFARGKMIHLPAHQNTSLRSCACLCQDVRLAFGLDTLHSVS